MPIKQKYGIKYPFSSENNNEIYVDLNESYLDATKSKVLHVLFTPKGQRLRMPDFGTNLVKFLFDPNDDFTINDLKNELKIDIGKYVPEVEFEDINVQQNEDNGRIVIVHYSVRKGTAKEITSVAVKI